MLDNSESLSNDEKFTENSVNNGDRTTASQNLQYTDIVVDKNVLVSTERHEKDHPLVKEEAQEIEKCSNRDIGEQNKEVSGYFDFLSLLFVTMIILNLLLILKSEQKCGHL